MEVTKRKISKSEPKKLYNELVHTKWYVQKIK